MILRMITNLQQLIKSKVIYELHKSTRLIFTCQNKLGTVGSL